MRRFLCIVLLVVGCRDPKVASTVDANLAIEQLRIAHDVSLPVKTRQKAVQVIKKLRYCYHGHVLDENHMPHWAYRK